MKTSLPAKILGVSLTSAILFTGIALPAQAAVTTPTEVTQIAAASDPFASQKTELLKWVNDYRAENGLKALTIDIRLGTVAQAWSDKTAGEGGFRHNPALSTQIPGGWDYAAEIIAASDSPEEIFYGWVNSYEHNQVLLSPKATVFGLGWAYQGNSNGEYPGSYYVTGIAANYPAPATSVTPTAPTYYTTTYVIPATTGVEYRVNGVITRAGTYNGKDDINITAHALNGYVLNGTTSWAKYYAPIVVIDPSPVVKAVIATAPTFTETTFTIPETTGVGYKVNGVATSAGNYKGNGTVTITAHALTGYALSGTSSWSKTFAPPLVSVIATNPTFTPTGYIIPEKIGVQYKVNGTLKNAGTYTETGTFTITATALPGYAISGASSWTATVKPTEPTPTPTPVANPSIKSAGDIVAIDPNGNLWNYGKFDQARVQIGQGWQDFTDIHQTDWNADGYVDIVGKTTSGDLYLYQAVSTGGFNRIQLGHGWQGYTIDIVQFDKRVKYPSIVATNTANGNLYNYLNENGGAITGVKQIGSGWGALGIQMVDWDKNGTIDVIAKNNAGSLILYRTDGNGNFLNESRQVIGSGWNIFNSISVVKNFNGTGTTGFMGRNTQGSLVYYQTNSSQWSSAKTVGSGWNGYKIANQ
jgi:uncharacterized protein YkwD